MGLGSDSETRRDAVVQKRDAVLPTSTHNSPASHCSHHAASPTWCEVCERVVSSASRFFHKRCNGSSVAQADGASTSAVRPVICNAVPSLVPLSPHRPSPGNCLREHSESRRLPHHASQRPAITPVEVDLRASAVLSSSECLFSGGDDALATHFLALTHHAWPNHDFGATTSSHDQIHNQTLNDQILNDSAAAATPQKPELGSSKEAAKPRVAAVARVAAAPKPHRPG